MPFSPFERDATQGSVGDPGPDQWREAAARPEIRASTGEEHEDPRGDESLDEPGYGHGV